jgi:GNAT superfamily N-acetyltransferase
MIRTVLIPTTETPADLVEPINAQYRAVFPYVNENGIDRNGHVWASGSLRILIYVEDVWGAIIELSPRTIYVGTTPIDIVGIGGVMTVPTMRGRGLASAGMRHAMRYICKSGYDAGALFCAEERRTFYEQLGWQRIHERKLTYQRNGQDTPFDIQRGNHFMLYGCDVFQLPAGDFNVGISLW